MSASTDPLFREVEKIAETSSKTKTSWTGILSINLPALNLGSVDYHLRLGKMKGSQEKPRIKHIDSVSGREVEAKDVVRFYRYTQDAEGRRSDPIEVSYEETKEKVRYPSTDGLEWLVSARKESRFFDSARLAEGKWLEVPRERVVDKQDDEQVEPFDRTTRIEIGEENFVPLARVPEYKFSEIYAFQADTDKKVGELPSRIRDLCRTLLEKQVALVGFFCWKKSYSFYTAVVYPYERKDGKMWLLMGTSEGILVLDEAWAIEEGKVEVPALAPVPQARKPKVVISK